MVDAYFATAEPDADAGRRGNKMARERMSILFDQAKKLGALVLGTSNKTEILLGYSTVFGDNASSLNPLGDLYKQQVWQLARHLGAARAGDRQGAVGRPLAGPDRRGRPRLRLRDGRRGALPALRPGPAGRTEVVERGYDERGRWSGSSRSSSATVSSAG